MKKLIFLPFFLCFPAFSSSTEEVIEFIKDEEFSSVIKLIEKYDTDNCPKETFLNFRIPETQQSIKSIPLLDMIIEHGSVEMFNQFLTFFDVSLFDEYDSSWQSRNFILRAIIDFERSDLLESFAEAINIKDKKTYDFFLTYGGVIFQNCSHDYDPFINIIFGPLRESSKETLEKYATEFNDYKITPVHKFFKKLAHEKSEALSLEEAKKRNVLEKRIAYLEEQVFNLTKKLDEVNLFLLGLPMLYETNE